MFDFLLSAEKKLRRTAAHWVETAGRVSDYRRDQLSAEKNQRLQTAISELKARIKDKSDVKVLQSAIGKLEAVMRDVGGRIYPSNSFVENIEFLVGAAILILGMRAYFIQPFKIPTNSMWPTYYGKTHELDKPGQSPGLARKAWRLVTLGGWHYQVNAPADGELMLPFFQDGQPAFTQKSGRSMLISPTVNREYRFAVNGEEVALTVPGGGTSTEDFRYERVLVEMLAAQANRAVWTDGITRLQNRQAGGLRQTEMEMVFNGQRSRRQVFWVPTGRMVKQGEPILSFDILTGDLLFVDRLTYNFFPPKVGQGFVFHTRQIPDIGVDQYYIKRLVGGPGDTLEVRRPAESLSKDGNFEQNESNSGLLFRNGQPIDGAEAFKKNATKDGLYPGYTATGLLGFGDVLHVPENKFFAMGDNSPNSSDGRFWGFVPDKEVVGRPLFIYYPLTSRWGPAK